MHKLYVVIMYKYEQTMQKNASRHRRRCIIK